MWHMESRGVSCGALVPMCEHAAAESCQVLQVLLMLPAWLCCSKYLWLFLGWGGVVPSMSHNTQHVHSLCGLCGDDSDSEPCMQ